MKIYTVKKSGDNYSEYYKSARMAEKEIEKIPGHWCQRLNTDTGETGQYITNKGFFASEIFILGWVEVK